MPELRAYFASNRVAGACLLLVTLAFLLLRSATIPLDIPRADQSQYLSYAFNTLKSGVFGVRVSDPDQRREPGYPLLLAVGMLVHPGIELDGSQRRCITAGEPDCIAAVTGLKAINVLFLGLSGIAAFATVLAVTGSPVAAWLAFLWLMASASYGQYVGRFFPEIVAGFLIVALSLRAWRLATTPPSRRSWFTTGLLLGALTLTKATFYYLAPLLAPALAVHAALARRSTWREAAILGCLLLAGTLVLTVPWQIRNLISTGTSALSGRAGLVLTVRANFDELPAGGELGAMATFTPHHTALRAYLSDRWLTPEVVAFLEPPNDPKTRGYDRQRELAQPRGYNAYSSQLDALLKDEALARIEANWQGHLRLTPVLAYRGLFTDSGFGFLPERLDDEDRAPRAGTLLLGMSPGWFYPAPIVQNALLFLPAILAFAWCVLTGRWALVFLMLPAAYLFGLQSFMSHNIARYSTPLIPILVVIGTSTAALLCRGILVSAKRMPASSPAGSAVSS